MPPTPNTPTAPSRGAQESAPEKAPVPVASEKGGFKAWLPLLANIVLMPLLAYGTFQFVILPKLQSGGSVDVHAKSANPSAGKGEAGGQLKQTAPLSAKILVNVAGTMGTRYLLANVTIVGTNPELKSKVELNDAELRDAAAGALSVKTISDLEKPGIRNLIRTELMSVFNNILGTDTVTDLYLTEFAIQ